MVIGLATHPLYYSWALKEELVQTKEGHLDMDNPQYKVCLHGLMNQTTW